MAKTKEPVIKAKKAPKIVSGVLYHYDPKTYKDLHKVSHFELVENAKGFAALLKHRMIAKKAAGLTPRIVIDTETYSTGLRIEDLPPNIVRRFVKKKPQDLPFAISICDGERAWLMYDNFEELREILEDETVEKIFHNAKFDMHMLFNFGLTLIRGYIWDTVVMCKLTNENRMSFKLKDMAKKYDKEANKWEVMKDNWLRENKVSDWRMIPRELLTDYGCADAWFTWLLFVDEYRELMEQELMDLYHTEEGIIRVLFRVERRGFKVSRSYFGALLGQFNGEIDILEAEIYRMAGGIFNTNSAPQLYKVLMALGVDNAHIPRTDKGNISIDAKVLEKLDAMDYEIASKIVELRQTEKLRGTYVEGILAQLDAEDRVHGNFNQTEATTGRMSVSQPSLQNIPKRKDKRIRRAFIPRDGSTLLFFDYDQVEYRLFAHYCQDPFLIEAIKKGWDVHRATAAMIYGVEYEDVTEEQRDRGKTINFGLIYGLGKEALALALKLTIDQAAELKRLYFRKLPTADDFIRMVQKVCKQRGWIKNFYGRRRRLKPEEVYKAVNALIQGAAADLMKQAMVRVQALLDKYSDDIAGIVCVVHDELIIEVRDEFVDELAPLIKEAMADVATFRVPITCDCKRSAPNWGDKATFDFSKTLEEQLNVA